MNILSIILYDTVLKLLIIYFTDQYLTYIANSNYVTQIIFELFRITGELYWFMKVIMHIHYHNLHPTITLSTAVYCFYKKQVSRRVHKLLNIFQL